MTWDESFEEGGEYLCPSLWPFSVFTFPIRSNPALLRGGVDVLLDLFLRLGGESDGLFLLRGGDFDGDLLFLLGGELDGLLRLLGGDLEGLFLLLLGGELDGFLLLLGGELDGLLLLFGGEFDGDLLRLLRSGDLLADLCRR